MIITPMQYKHIFVYEKYQSDTPICQKYSLKFVRWNLNVLRNVIANANEN